MVFEMCAGSGVAPHIVGAAALDCILSESRDAVNAKPRNNCLPSQQEAGSKSMDF